MNNEETYTDVRGNKHNVKHSTVWTDEEKRELEERIADELYRIFTNK